MNWMFLAKALLPFQALLTNGTPTDSHPWTLNTGGCSGTAISPQAVLTAAHCQVSGVWLGKEWIPAARSYVHPMYKIVPNCAASGFLNLHDLRVVYFSTPVFDDFMPLSSSPAAPIQKVLTVVGARNRVTLMGELRPVDSREYPEAQFTKMVTKAKELGYSEAAISEFDDVKMLWSECYAGVLLSPLFAGDGTGDTQTLPEPGDSGGSIIYQNSLVGMVSGKIGYYSKETGAPLSVTGMNAFLGESQNQAFFRDLNHRGIDIRWSN